MSLIRALGRTLMHAGARSMGARSVEGARTGILSHVPAHLRDDQTALAYGVGAIGGIGALAVPYVARAAHYSNEWEHLQAQRRALDERAAWDQQMLLQQLRASRLPPFGTTTSGVAAQPAEWDSRPIELERWEDDQ